MIAECKKEIYSIHEFFEDWLNGRPEKDTAVLQRVHSVMNDRFLMISPNGTEIDRDGLNENLMKAHGSWNGEQIWIKHIRCRYQHRDLCLVVYEEWQGLPGGADPQGRLSSALFKKADDSTIQWLHLHEVWIK
ncbi:MAG: hypothetical protein GVY08_10355 [Bacteroidetes bacterium]|jgi:hypothetical protein|nr:hypothetical protein [Bacteroidota bacterium]